jgi:hypothetical protein
MASNCTEQSPVHRKKFRTFIKRTPAMVSSRPTCISDPRLCRKSSVSLASAVLFQQRFEPSLPSVAVLDPIEAVARAFEEVNSTATT